MITLPRHVRVHAYAAPADLRKGFEGLSALVREELDRDPLSGDLFLFTNRTRRRSKVLLFDGTGRHAGLEFVGDIGVLAAGLGK